MGMSVLTQERKYGLIVGVRAFRRHGVRTSGNDDTLAVWQATLQLVHDQIKEFWAPFSAGKQRRGADRFGHLAGKDRPREFRHRIGLEGSRVLQIHFLVGVGTALISARSADDIHEERYGALDIAGPGGLPCRH